MAMKLKIRQSISYSILIVLFAAGLIFVSQTEQAKAVDIKALLCGGSGTTIPGVTTTFSNTTLGVAGRGCTTSPSGTCNIPTRAVDGGIPIPAGVYNVAVSKAGYTVNTAAPCLTPSTYNTSDIIAFLEVYLTPTTTGAPAGTYGLTNKPLKDIINGITEWLLGIAAGLAILYLVWGGIYYVTASGDEGQIEDAKRIIKYALIGLFVIGISYSIVVALDKLIK